MSQTITIHRSTFTGRLIAVSADGHYALCASECWSGRQAAALERAEKLASQAGGRVNRFFSPDGGGVFSFDIA